MLAFIKERRSHFLKEFNGKKAPDSIIQEMLEASIWAPSHRLTLPFRYEVFPPNQLGYLSTAIESSYRKKGVDIDPLKIKKNTILPREVITCYSHRIQTNRESPRMGGIRKSRSCCAKYVFTTILQRKIWRLLDNGE